MDGAREHNSTSREYAPGSEQHVLLRAAYLPGLPVLDTSEHSPGQEGVWHDLTLPDRPAVVQAELAEVAERSPRIEVKTNAASVPTRGLLSGEGESFGPLFLQKRIGKDGAEFTVIKLITMRPESDFSASELQRDYTLGKFGKIEDHPRVTPLGRILRKYWLDEIPQLINVLKGDMQLIGWRPLTGSDLATYSEDFQAAYRREKPGLISPLYAKDVVGREQVEEEGRTYFARLQENRLATKLSYLCQAIWGIVAHGRRGF